MFGSPSDSSLEREGRAYPTQKRIGTVCVFGGAQLGHDPDLAHCASVLGLAVAGAGIRLVYGGGCDGLMGRVAIAAAEAGGTVVAITPQFLIQRMTMLSPGCHTIAVPDLGVRKQLMFDYADAFVALPGGIGTLEELTEVMTLGKLERHCKPLVLANFKGFWSPLLGLFESLAKAGFMKSSAGSTHLVEQYPDAILPLLQRSVRFDMGDPPPPVLLPTMPVLRRSSAHNASAG